MRLKASGRAAMTVRAALAPPSGGSLLFTTVRLRTVENGEAWLIRRKSIADMMDGNWSPTRPRLIVDRLPTILDGL